MEDRDLGSAVDRKKVLEIRWTLEEGIGFYKEGVI